MPIRNCLFKAFTILLLSTAPPPPGVAQDSGNAIGEQAYTVTLPSGTVIPVITTAYLNTKSSQAGDIVYVDTTYPIWIQQQLVIPKGSTIRGTVTEVVRPGRIKGKGRLAIRFDDILLPNGIRRDIITSLHGIHGPGDENVARNTESVSAGGNQGEDVTILSDRTVQGAIVGAAAGGGKGAAIGSGIGAAAGVATILFTRGRDLILAPGTQFDLELLKPLEFSYYDIQFSESQLDSVRPTRIDRSVRPPGDRDKGGRIQPIPGIGLPIPF